MYYAPTDHLTFYRHFAHAQAESDTVRKATTPAVEVLHSLGVHDRAYLATDSASGFIVRHDGELIAVWSLVRGRGDGLVSSATRRGATHLDCFDGVLPILYARHGFVCTKRVANYNGPNHPDVVFMRRGGL